MSVANFFNKIVYVKRAKITSGYKSNFCATATADASIQKLDEEHAGKVGAVTGKSYFAYFEEDTTIAEGDIIEEKSGKRYEVKDITRVDFGINTHLEVLIEELNE